MKWKDVKFFFTREELLEAMKKPQPSVIVWVDREKRQRSAKLRDKKVYLESMEMRVEEEFVEKYVEFAKPPSDLPEKARIVLADEARRRATALLKMFGELGFELKRKEGAE